MPGPGPASGGRPRGRSAAWAALTIAVLTFGYRWTAPVAEFCPLDDGMNLAVAAQAADGHWASLLPRAGGRFLPVYWGTSAVTNALAGPDPLAFHWVNTTLLLVGLLAAAGWVRRRCGSWIAGTAAAVLVLASSSVGEHLATLGKNELKAVCFLGLGLLLADLCGESESPRVRWSAGPAAAMAAFLGGAGKETGIIVAAVPAAALGARWLAGRPSPEPREWRSRARASLALAAGALAYVIVRALVPGTESAYTTVGWSWATVEAGLGYYLREAPDLWLLILAAGILWGVCALRRGGISPRLADAAGCLAAAFGYLAVLLWWHVHQRYYLLLPVLLVACAAALAANETRSLPAGRERRWARASAGLLAGSAVLVGVPVSSAVLQTQTRHDAAWAAMLGAFARSPAERLSIETESWYSEHVSGAALLLRHAYGADGREVVGTRDLLNPSLVLPGELRLHGVDPGTLAEASRAPAAGDRLLVVAETTPAFALRGVGTAVPNVETRWPQLGARVERVDEGRRGFEYRLAPSFVRRRYRIAWALYRVEAPPWVVPAPPSFWREDGWVGSVLRLRALRPLPGGLWLEGRSHPDRGVRLRVRSPGHVWEDEVAAGAAFRAPLAGAAGLAAGAEATVEAVAEVAADDPDPAIRWLLDRLDREPGSSASSRRYRIGRGAARIGLTGVEAATHPAAVGDAADPFTAAIGDLTKPRTIRAAARVVERRAGVGRHRVVTVADAALAGVVTAPVRSLFTGSRVVADHAELGIESRWRRVAELARPAQKRRFGHGVGEPITTYAGRSCPSGGDRRLGGLLGQGGERAHGDRHDGDPENKDPCLHGPPPSS